MRLIKISAAVAALFLVLLLLLPIAIQQIMSSQVRSLGLGELTIDNTDFNPFLLELSVSDFRLEHAGIPYLSGRHAAVDLAWRDLLNGTVGIDAVDTEGLEFWLRESEDGQWTLLPPMETTADSDAGEETGSPLYWRLDALTLSDTRLHVESHRLAGMVHLPDVQLQELFNSAVRMDQTTTSLSGEWNGAGITLTTSKQLTSDQPPFEINLAIHHLPLADFQQLAGVDTLAGTLDVNLTVRGKLSHSPLLRAGTPGVDADVELELELNDIQAAAEGYQVTLAELGSQVSAQVHFLPGEGSSGEDYRYAIRMDATTGAFSTSFNEQPVAAWQQLMLRELKVDSDQVLALSSLNLTGVQAGIEIDEEGGLVLPVEETPEADEVSEVLAEADAEESSPWQIRVGEMSLDGNLQFTDRSVAPVFVQPVMIESLKVTDVDTGSPDQPLTVTLRSRLDDYARVDLDATVTPFRDKPGVEASADIRQVPLDRMTAYLEKAIGYEVRTGQLDLKGKVALADDVVDADMDVLLRRFRVNRAEGSDLDAELGMPLGAALGLVRDGDGNITLNDFRIDGDLGDPAVSARGLVSKAFSKALMAGTMTYFQFALQPYGAAMMAVNVLGKQAGKVSLDPLAMVPLTDNIDPANADYLERLSKILTDRPGIHLVICGEASTVADVEQTEDTEAGQASGTGENAAPAPDPAPLLALADARAKRVKADLFSRGIASDRLLICKASLNDSPDGARVVLSVD